MSVNLRIAKHRASPEGKALAARRNAEHAALAAWLAAEPDVVVTQHCGYAPEVWEGSVDGRTSSATAIVSDIDTGQVRDQPACPADAVRELVGNALIHRNLAPWALGAGGLGPPESAGSASLSPVSWRWRSGSPRLSMTDRHAHALC